MLIVDVIPHKSPSRATRHRAYEPGPRRMRPAPLLQCEVAGFVTCRGRAGCPPTSRRRGAPNRWWRAPRPASASPLAVGTTPAGPADPRARQPADGVQLGRGRRRRLTPAPRPPRWAAADHHHRRRAPPRSRRPRRPPPTTPPTTAPAATTARPAGPPRPQPPAPPTTPPPTVRRSSPSPRPPPWRRRRRPPATRSRARPPGTTGTRASAPTRPAQGHHRHRDRREHGASTTCVVTDRGPYGAGRIIDLDATVFDDLAGLGTGVIDVVITW